MRELLRFRHRVVAALLVVLFGSAGCPASDGAPSREFEGSTLSLLATGDTGKRHRFSATLLEGQIAVAEGMVFEDERQPVDAIVLLGDNFYPGGLLQEELVPRIRENVVRPYCHFLALDGPRSDEVRDACPIAAAERHPIPLYVILGNHDLMSRESPELQRTAIPEFVPGWSLGPGFGRVVELPHGVSLILVNVEYLEGFDRSAALADLLRQARGPWRIVVGHRPPTVNELGGENPIAGARADLHNAISQAQAPVHVFLSGHQHSLQLLVSSTPDPSLAVIAGSGARYRLIEAPHPQRVFARAALGFARIDLRGAGEDERLVVTLFAVSDYPALGTGPERVASWSVDRSGRTRDEF